MHLRNVTAHDLSSPVWAVTSYFNPVGYRSRRANYDVFRRQLELPLLTVEWSRDGRFELGPGDAEMLVQLDGGDLMWQKERLLNIGIGRLPAACTHVAWVDCDIVFEREGLADAIVSGLAQSQVVQLFDRAFRVGREANFEDARMQLLEEVPGAVAADLHFPAWPSAALERAPARPAPRPPTPGYAWAARREFLERHALFDTWVLGGGDRAFHCALTGAVGALKSYQALSEAHLRHYLPRAEALDAQVGRRIGCIGGAVLSLWHGSQTDRRYRTRHEILTLHGYDPEQFLMQAGTGVWAWADVPERLPGEVADYFALRNEDGADPETSVA